MAGVLSLVGSAGQFAEICVKRHVLHRGVQVVQVVLIERLSAETHRRIMSENSANLKSNCVSVLDAYVPLQTLFSPLNKSTLNHLN